MRESQRINMKGARLHVAFLVTTVGESAISFTGFTEIELKAKEMPKFSGVKTALAWGSVMVVSTPTGEGRLTWQTNRACTQQHIILCVGKERIFTWEDVHENELLLLPSVDTGIMESTFWNDKRMRGSIEGVLKLHVMNKFEEQQQLFDFKPVLDKLQQKLFECIDKSDPEGFSQWARELGEILELEEKSTK